MKKKRKKKRETIVQKEMWPLNECVFYVQIQAAKTGLFLQFIG